MNDDDDKILSKDLYPVVEALNNYGEEATTTRKPYTTNTYTCTITSSHHHDDHSNHYKDKIDDNEKKDKVGTTSTNTDTTNDRVSWDNNDKEDVGTTTTTIVGDNDRIIERVINQKCPTVHHCHPRWRIIMIFPICCHRHC